MPANEEEKQRIRLSMDVDRSVKDRIEKVLKTIDAASYTEVVRRSISLLELILEEEKKGKKIILRSKDGSEETLHFLL